jgi:hypothetical protein
MVKFTTPWSSSNVALAVLSFSLEQLPASSAKELLARSNTKRMVLSRNFIQLLRLCIMCFRILNLRGSRPLSSHACYLYDVPRNVSSRTVGERERERVMDPSHPVSSKKRGTDSGLVFQIRIKAEQPVGERIHSGCSQCGACKA